ncbi:MAG: hypothetical protein ACRENI_14445 [Gemmatimonadaceae bacterium]
MQDVLSNYLPDAGGAIWLGALVALLVFGDFNRLLSLRNLALAGLLATAPLLNDIGRWNFAQHPRFTAGLWTAIFLVTAAHTVWALMLARSRPRRAWVPNLTRPALVVLAALLVAMNALTTLIRPAEDAGHYTNLGAQRWMETGISPYADSLLQGAQSPGHGAASTYGPVLYVAHMPLLLLLGDAENPADASVMSPDYRRPSDLATQGLALLFHLAGLWALYVIVRRHAGERTALGAVILYACMPYLAGLEAGHGSIAGLRFISHIAPSALLLLGIAYVGSPLLSGLLLAAATGVLFFPIFIFPAWLGWRVWRGEQPLRFLAGSALGGAIILAVIVAFTPSGSATESVGTFVHAITEHQEGSGPMQYGESTFGFWGTHPELSAFWHSPIAGDSPFMDPAFLGFLALATGAFFWARRSGGVAELAALTAAVGAGVQLWKTHGGGTYVEWYLPLLIVALVSGSRAAQAATATPDVAMPEQAVVPDSLSLPRSHATAPR